MHERQRSWRQRVGRWAAELLLVFVGAYAAFWLNNYQEHREAVRRHRQILAVLENEVTNAIAGAKAERVKSAGSAKEFRRDLDAGEMPHLGTFSFASDYDPTDTAAMLEAGGYQLLDVKTIVALRNLESVARSSMAEISHIEKRSDELIAPNLDQEISFFYDPATKKLRRRFLFFPDALDRIVRFQTDLIAAETELLAQIKNERQRY